MTIAERFEQLLWQNESLLDAFSLDKPRELFHYTDIHGLYGIVRDNGFWATDYRFLNDLEEREYGRRKIISCLDDYLRGEFPPQTRRLLTETKNRLENHVFKQSIFVTSFNENGDLLSQWRAYADNARGFSIGLLSEELDRTRRKFPHSSVVIRKVIYGEDEQLRFIREVLDQCLRIFAAEGGVYEDGMCTAAALFLLEVGNTLKHPAFEEEREWRAIAYPGLMEGQAPIQYRLRNNLLIPYLTIDLSPNANRQPHHPTSRLPNAKLPISTIVCGPGVADNTKQLSLPMFLEHHGLSPVITESAAPYRALNH